ncbi:MAG: M20/M25/M40 family metallo-hydrolase [Vallitaleaceae bacterium]|nr:M20/M25/M40 family metallo-hydrolase [Vallitaleaceae bacterium]
MNINPDRMITEFTNLVSIDSKSYEERAMADYIKARLLSLGFTVTEDDWGNRFGGNCGNVYGYLEGDQTLSPLLFSSHMDTVEPCTSKKAVVGDDGIIRSAGNTILGADDCAGIAAILEALSTINETNSIHRPIEVLFTVAEEVYCKGAAAFDFSKLHSREAYVLDLTGPVGTAAYKAPTLLSFTVKVKGKSAHAGFAPEEGVHSILACAKAISTLKMGRMDTETTLNIGVIKGGTANNIIPDTCEVTGEIRSYSHDTALQTAERVRHHFIDAVSIFGATAEFELQVQVVAYETAIDHPVIERFQDICANNQLPFSLVSTFGGSDNHHLASHNIIGIVIANAMNGCHSCEEYTTVEELIHITELTYGLMTSKL